MTTITSVHKASFHLTRAQYAALIDAVTSTFDDWTYPNGHVQMSTNYAGYTFDVVFSAENALDLMEFVANVFMILPGREDVEVEKSVVEKLVVPLDKTLEDNRATNTAVDQDEIVVPATEDYDSELVEAEEDEDDLDDDEDVEEETSDTPATNGGRIKLKKPLKASRVAAGVSVEDFEE